MGCGCKLKNDSKIQKKQETKEIKKVNKVTNVFTKSRKKEKLNFKNIGKFIIKNTFKILAFLLALFLVPIIALASIWFMFELLVLNQDIDMVKITKVLSSKLKFANESNFNLDDEDDEEFNSDDYVAIDVEDISHQKN